MCRSLHCCWRYQVQAVDLQLHRFRSVHYVHGVGVRQPDLFTICHLLLHCLPFVDRSVSVKYLIAEIGGILTLTYLVSFKLVLGSN